MSDAAIAAPEKSSRWEDLLDVFISPVELFERRRDESWLKPLGLLLVISIVLYYAFISPNSAIWEAAMVQNAPEGADLEQMRQGAQFMKWLGGIFVPFTYLFLIAVTALGLKLASAVLEPAASWKQSFLIATFAMFVAIPQQIVTALLIMVKGGDVTMQDASFGLLRFLDPDSLNNALNALLGRLDLFAIWSAVICAIGLIVVVGMPRAKAAAAAAIAWVLVAIPGVIGGLLSGN